MFVDENKNHYSKLFTRIGLKMSPSFQSTRSHVKRIVPSTIHLLKVDYEP